MSRPGMRWDPDTDQYVPLSDAERALVTFPDPDGCDPDRDPRAWVGDGLPAAGHDVAAAAVPLLLAAAGAVAATAIGTVVLLIGGVLITLLTSGLVLLATGALVTAYLRRGRRDHEHRVARPPAP